MPRVSAVEPATTTHEALFLLRWSVVFAVAGDRDENVNHRRVVSFVLVRGVASAACSSAPGKGI